jgi:hypothetical protein
LIASKTGTTTLNESSRCCDDILDVGNSETSDSDHNSATILSPSRGKKRCVISPCLLPSTIMYVFELPTTGALSFSDLCTDQSSDQQYGFRFSQVTEARANLRAALKDAKRTDGFDKDTLKLVKVRYLMQEICPGLTFQARLSKITCPNYRAL